MKVASIVGARPQFIKAAVVSRELRKHHQEVLSHTGQHYDENMSAVFFGELEIPEPDYNLGVGAGPQGAQTGEMLKRIEEVLLKERPDMVLVYGDTNSTLAGALAAAKLHTGVAHVEAGLRSFNRRMPEEINRILTDHVSDLLFCPTETAATNLEREGITSGVHLVGDVMHNSFLHNVEIAERSSAILEKLALAPKGYALATVHRAENTEDEERLGSIFRALDEIGLIMPVIVPLHPRTRKYLPAGMAPVRARVIEPAPYLDMLVLEKHARVILTDSGGVQKEAYWLRVPCVTLRDETEWVETVEAGWNILVGHNSARIKEAALHPRPDAFRPTVYGNGHAAERILERIDRWR